ncbi:MAG: lipopolysaccharide transport periplasmic protein LptA [Proteobacteria bacterium]|nr:lipopolysaccharide transport periplasmic protein LptA [Pseudomonadota bacterium]
MPSTTDLFRTGVLIAALGVAQAVFALGTDRSKPLNVDADHWQSTQSQTGKAGDPDITRLDGNVVMTQGSMQTHADHATIYKNPSAVADANGNYGSLTRVVLTGKPAHLQQVHDGDCSLMTADADTIDYDNLSGIALLTGNVTVIQHGKGEFHGQRMRYNTNTGEMESGDASPSSRVHMVMQPKAAQPKPAANADCSKAAAAQAH